MPAVHFTNLLIVVAIRLLAPLGLGFFPRRRLPAIVFEIVLGIAVGPSGLGWVTPDLPVSILATRPDPEGDGRRVPAVIRDRDHPRPGLERGRLCQVAAYLGRSCSSPPHWA